MTQRRSLVKMDEVGSADDERREGRGLGEGGGFLLHGCETKPEPSQRIVPRNSSRTHFSSTRTMKRYAHGRDFTSRKMPARARREKFSRAAADDEEESAVQNRASRRLTPGDERVKKRWSPIQREKQKKLKIKRSQRSHTNTNTATNKWVDMAQ